MGREYARAIELIEPVNFVELTSESAVSDESKQEEKKYVAPLELAKVATYFQIDANIENFGKYPNTIKVHTKEQIQRFACK